MKQWNRKRLDVAGSQKGFTLVELIVVLVILAILSAITVPALTGWIDKAKTRTAMIQARTVYLAAQTGAAEYYGGLEPDLQEGVTDGTVTVSGRQSDEDTMEGEIAALAGIGEDYTAEITLEDGRVTGVTYCSGDGIIVSIGDGNGE